MKINTIYIASIIIFAANNSRANEEEKIQERLMEIKQGTISSVAFENAPSNVSALSFIGIDSDTLSVIENVRDFTLSLKAIDSDNSFGLSITPARTNLMPVNIHDYYRNPYTRLWASTTFSYAQGKSDINEISFERKAYSVEASYFLEKDKDDPLIIYWNDLKGSNKESICNILEPEEPDQNGSVEFQRITDDDSTKNRAQKCREASLKKARWNASRLWGSLATGRYKEAGGGQSGSLGTSAVIGVTWGHDFGSYLDIKQSAIALTAGVKIIANAPTLETMANPTPEERDTVLAVIRAAYGSENFRFILEGSNIKNRAPTALDRNYKTALGIDMKVSEELWLKFRHGKQRRIDNSGEENGTILTISYSPKPSLSL